MSRHCRLWGWLLATLAGCGGGGSVGGNVGGNAGIAEPAPPMSTQSPVITPATANLQGIWESSSAGVKTSAVVLPNGQTWLVQRHVNGDIDLVIAELEASGEGYSSAFIGSGKRYQLGTTVVGAVDLNAGKTASSNLSMTWTTTGVTEIVEMGYQNRYDAAATLADHAGDWIGKPGPGALNWHITATGLLSGSSSTGCTYVGQIKLRAEAKAVVDVSLAEQCAGKSTQLAGIALLSADQRSATLAMTTVDGLTAWLLAMTH
jgi:hypothetical protein